MSTHSKKRKHFHRFLLLWFGQLISSVGTGMSAFALGIYVYQKTGLATSSTLITLVAFLPSLLLSPLAGVLADRHDRRLLMIAGDGLSAIGLLYIIFSLKHGGNFWQIALGVGISSVFSSLLEPSYRASVTDMLKKEDYARANGLLQLAGSARFLISPIAAGFLMSLVPLWVLLLFDVATIFLTVSITFLVAGNIPKNQGQEKSSDGLISRDFWKEKEAGSGSSLWKELWEGISVLHSLREVFVLVLLCSLLTFFIGILQTMAAPMILAFSTQKTVGIILSASALGMLFASAAISAFSLKGPYLPKLRTCLFFAGLFMAGFGLQQHTAGLLLFGMAFFAMMPLANTCLDVLVRSNIENRFQGRLWGLVGILSQLGYVAAYGIAGPFSDWVLTPLLHRSCRLDA